MGIGSKLEALMRDRHTNANELAQKIGVAPTTIYSMIKRDSKKADIDVLLRIAQALNVDVSYFGDVPASESPTKDSDAFSEEAVRQDFHPSYEDVASLIARNGKHMSQTQKMRLIQLLSSLDDE